MSRPFVIPLINRLGAGMQAIGLDPAPLLPQKLQNSACRRTGLRDFGATDYQQGLQVLCESANVSGKLNFIGQMALSRQIRSALITRLQMVELRKTQPQIFEHTDLAPLVVVGMPRSGTTYLHRLLSLDPALRHLKFWEVANPLPLRNGRKDRRRQQTMQDLKWIKRIAPELDAKHYLHADEAEECLFLLNPTFKSLAFWVSSPVYGYLEWLHDQDCSEAYEFYRDLLMYFQRQSPDRQLVLKSPVHLGYLREFRAAIPKARFIFTHRDAIAVQGSANSLFRTLFGIVSKNLDVPRMARTNFDLLSIAAERALEARRLIPNAAFLDLSYPDLLAHPVRCVQNIYRHFGLEFTASFQRELQTYIASRPQHKFGVHQYTLKEFGLSEAEVEERFRHFAQLAPSKIEA
ncbi:MAG: sulfotransferase [Planctomycetes bacterium]|nr:sulfotransferase [Planctomycetota bacterium]